MGSSAAVVGSAGVWAAVVQGGRVAVSDIALKQPLPEDVAGDVLAYIGCVAGAVLITDYEGQLKEAGFDVPVGTTRLLAQAARAVDRGIVLESALI